MGGSKRNKVKRLLSPRSATPAPPEPALNDDDLMDDLMAQLESKDVGTHTEAAVIVNEMEPIAVAEAAEAAPKQDSKSRHKARQVRLLSDLRL